MWMWVPVRFHSSVVCWGCTRDMRVSPHEPVDTKIRGAGATSQRPPLQHVALPPRLTNPHPSTSPGAPLSSERPPQHTSARGPPSLQQSPRAGPPPSVARAVVPRRFWPRANLLSPPGPALLPPAPLLQRRAGPVRPEIARTGHPPPACSPSPPQHRATARLPPYLGAHGVDEAEHCTW
jgi:hypothetical protein